MKTLFILAGCLLSLAACNVNKSLKADFSKLKDSVNVLSRGVGRNLAGGVSDSAALIARRLIAGFKGAMDTLDPDIRKVYHALDSIGSLGSDKLVALGNTLDSQIVRIKAELNLKSIPPVLDAWVKKLTHTLNDSTKNLLANTVQAALASMGTDASKRKMDSALANLLDDKAKAQVSAFLAAALTPALDTAKNRLHGELTEDLPFVKKQAVWLLVAIGLIAMAIIGLVWYQKRRYARLVAVLTYHINGIASSTAYDDLTRGISKQTTAEILEPLLRKTLKRQGINH